MNVKSLLALGFFGAILITTAFLILTSVPIWLLWNALFPVIFGLSEITWLQALGITLLSNLLFKTPNFGSGK